MTNSILLITVDCLRADHVSGYGYHRATTPSIDKLIRRGTKYTRAFSNGPGTRFGFKSIHGGVHPLRIKGTGLPRHADVTIAELLSERGYQTGGFSDNPFVSSYFNYHRGFDEFADYTQWMSGKSGTTLHDVNRIVRQRIGQSIPEGRVYDTLKWGYDTLIKIVETKGANVNSNDKSVVDHAIDWIAKAEEQDDPYFTWIHLMDAHHPYGYFPEHRQSLGVPSEREHIRMPSVEPGSPPSKILVDAYDANIRNADEHVGRLLREVEGDPIVVLTADHGEELGLHNRFHKESVYQSMAHVPLIIDAPEFNAAESDAAVSLIDIPTTIAHVADADVPGGWDGTDVRDRKSDESVFLGFENREGISAAVIRDQWKYMRQQDSLAASPETESLFDVVADPEESQNRIDDVDAVYRRLRDECQNYIDEIGSAKLKAERELWDPSKDLSKTVQTSRDDVPSGSPDGIDQRLEDLGYK